MPLSLRAFRGSGGLIFLLSLLLLIPFIFVASPGHAASSQASSARQGTRHVGTVAPVRTSTTTAPHHVSGSTPLQPSQTTSGLHPNTVTATTSFPGQQGPSVGQQNPSADAGRYNIMELAHQSVTIYDRSGNLQYSDDLNAWFGSRGIWTGDVIYDPWNEQFAFIATDNSNTLYIAVAQQRDALGSYCNYTFSFNTAVLPSQVVTAQAVGFDETYLYFTANEYVNGHPTSGLLYQINLKQMESCSAESFWTWSVMDAGGQPALGLVPAMKYNFPVAHDEEYLVEPILSGGCSITLWRINNHVLSSNTVNTECYSPPPKASQPGDPNSLQTGLFGALFHQATFVNGLLDFALATGHTMGKSILTSAIAWLKVDPVAATVSQQGYIGRSGFWYFNPAMAQDINNNSVIVFNVASASLPPSVWYVAQNADGSQQNTLKLVTSTGNTPTLGDYQSARLDPIDSVHIWICGSSAQPSPGWVSGWASQIAQTAAS